MNCAAVVREQLICSCVRVIATMFYKDCQLLKSVYLKFPNCLSVNEGISNENRYSSFVLLSGSTTLSKLRKTKIICEENIMVVLVLITTQKLKVSLVLGDLLAGRRLIICLPLRGKSGMEDCTLQANFLYLCPWKGHGQDFLEPISKHIKDRKLIRGI